MVNSLVILHIVIFVLSFIFFEYKIIKDKWLIFNFWEDESASELDGSDFLVANVLNMIISMIVVLIMVVLILTFFYIGVLGVSIVMIVLLIKYLLWQLFKSVNNIGGKK